MKNRCSNALRLAICNLALVVTTLNAVATPDDPAWEKSRMFRENLDLKAQAENLVAQKQFAQAAEVYEQMADLAQIPKAGAWARVMAADSYLAAGNIEAARNAYEDALNTHPALIDFAHVLQKLRDIANYYAANQTSLLGLPVSRVNRAIDIYETILAKAPAGVRAPFDTLRLAKLQAAAGEEDAAKVTLGEIIRRFPTSPAAPLARLELAGILATQAEKQQNYFQVAKEARRQAQQFIRFHPGHDERDTAEQIIRRANARIAEYYLQLGRFYSHPAHENIETAKRYLGMVLQDFPDTAAASAARQELAALDQAAAAPPAPAATADPDAPVSIPPPATEPEPVVTEPDPDLTPTYTAEELKAREKIETTLLPLEAAGLPEFDSIAVGKIENTTREPEIARYLTLQLAEQIMMDPDVQLQAIKDADIVVEARIKDITFAPAASAKIREENETPDELGTYSTTIFRTYVDIEYRVLASDGAVAVAWTAVRGEADFPETPDLNINRQDAFKQACNDAALRIVSNITEAW